MTAIVKTVLIAAILYTGLFLACPKQTKNASNAIVSATYGKLINVGQ